MASITLAYDGGHYDALVSRFIFVGVNTGIPKANGTSLFKEFRNHADAVASVLLTSATDAQFDPSQGIHTRPVAYFDFLENTVRFPAFRYRGLEDHIQELHLDGGLDQFLDEISEHYYRIDCHSETGNMTVEELMQRRLNIRKVFKKLVPKTIENKDWKRWLFSTVTIQKPKNSDKVSFEFAQVRLTISQNGGNINREGTRGRTISKTPARAVIDRQVALLVKSCYFVDGGYMSFFSDEIANFIESGSVDELQALMTTKLGSDILEMDNDRQIRL
ncbi:hypothetical protein BGZ76_000685 [Entomortierella beljakovae]|nr:hypothetical protein BGZ76_000685 [Entomortierella beljakovae]